MRQIALMRRSYTFAEMKQELWCGPTRIYFNAWEDAPRYWSADQGLGTPEITAECVSFEGAEMTTMVNAASKEQPRAWMEGEARVLRTDGGTLLIQRL